MSAMQSEIYEAFRSIDIPEDKALKATAALGKGPHGNKGYDIVGPPPEPDPEISGTYSRGSPKRDDTAASFAKRDVEIAAIKGDLSVLK